MGLFYLFVLIQSNKLRSMVILSKLKHMCGWHAKMDNI